jgi:hypothetical protein
MKALKVFSVKHNDIRIKVRLLPTIRDVHREHQRGYLRAVGKTICAFFAPSRRSDAKHVGIIVLPLDKRLPEFIPHEVTHAVLHQMGSVLSTHDEAFATAVGVLSMLITKKIGAAA